VLWVADITYLRTWEGWVYLAAVQDAYSRRIVGWSMADHMRAELVVDALEMALHRRRPGPGLIHHSDQGSQFVSLAFGQKARDAGIAVSMGSKGCAYDNAGRRERRERPLAACCAGASPRPTGRACTPRSWLRGCRSATHVSGAAASHLGRRTLATPRLWLSVHRRPLSFGKSYFCREPAATRLASS
jgi:transposase InsO family protein